MATGQLAQRLGIENIDIILYHRLGLNKYKALDRECLDLDKPSIQVVHEAVKILHSFSLNVSVI